MDLLVKARRLETNIARGVANAARNLVRGSALREPIELAHAIVDAVEQEIQPGDRGTRVFPFNTIEVSIVAPSDHARARIETIVNGTVSLRERIVHRLCEARSPVADLDVTINYVAWAQRDWPDPQYSIAFSRIDRPASMPVASESVHARLELTVVHGAADWHSYAFTSERIDLGRGHEVRDRRNGLIRINHVAFDDGNGSISRRHAHIACDPNSGQFRVHDDGSAHGTKIVRKGRTVPVPFGSRGVRLESGDEIVLGEARLRARFGAGT